MAHNTIDIRIIPGNVAPRKQPGVRELTCERVDITEQGTEKGLPVVDFVLRDADGKEYWIAFTGRIVNGISAAIKGVNERVHGIAEP